MKKRALRLTIIREIFQSKARFLSILGIILLGVCFYAGIKATGPDMLNTADDYFAKQRLMDLKIVSTMGLTKEDVELLGNDPRVAEFEPAYSVDVNLTTDNRAVRFLSYDKENKKRVNDFVVTKGRLPEKSGEIAFDNQSTLYESYKIGDTFEVESGDDSQKSFKEKTYKIVGFVNSPMYIENISRGNTTVGSGSIDFFGVIPKEDFDLEAYTELYLRYKKTNETIAYSKEYKQQAKDNRKQIKSTFKKRPDERLAEIKKEAQKPIDEAKAKLSDGEKELTEGNEKLETSRKELADGKVQLTNARNLYYQKIQEGENQLVAKKTELNNGKNLLTVKENEAAQAKIKLDSTSIELTKAESKLRESGIDPNTNVATINSQIQQIQLVADGLNRIATDILATVPTINEGEPIPDAKLQSWANGLTNPLVDLSSVSSGLLALLGVPMVVETRGQVLAIAPQLSAGASEVELQRVALDQLVSVVTTFQGGKRQYNQGVTQYEQGKNQLITARQTLVNGEAALSEGWATLDRERANGQTLLANSEIQLVDAENAIDEGEKQLQEEGKKLADGKIELGKQEKKLADLKKPTYYFFTRDDNPGYGEYKENASRISSIATVFPVFFFMIAALVSLTTMTRMVDEKRGEIGTMKALGYSNWEISQKYLIYAAVASLAGSVIGLLVGFNVFPSVIYNAYGSLYNLPPVIITYYRSYTIQSIIVALLCTVVSALVVLRVDLASTPASLMRPKAPKAGQRIFLERITFIWKRLSFNRKVTARNLFRYKQRMFMTVFGIAGCMALMITGFGLRDSITDVVDIQFDKLWHYQATVVRKDDASEEETKKYEEALEKLPKYDSRLTVSMKSMRVMQSGVTTQKVTVDVPKDVENLADFILFNNRQTKEVYKISDNGVVVNEKLAKMFSLKIGDTFELTDSTNKKFLVKVDQIVENYAMHFVYMTPIYYEKVFKNEPTYNSDLLLFKEKLTEKEEKSIANKLMTHDNVVNASFLSHTSRMMDDTVDSLNIVVWVLIVSAASLAFIVLYNLTNINISERIRELSTIKVLGFYDNEVTMYVYRENNILTLLGILVGFLAGKLLHGFVLQTAEVDMLMFSPTIHIQSYMFSTLLTIFFSFIVMLVMHRKLRKVDMIEALKSNE